MRIVNENTGQQAESSDIIKDVSRRRFLQMAGGVAGAGLLFAACRRSGPTDIYIGSGDKALLNYLYVLEQVEAAFYTQSVATPYYGLNQGESVLLTDLRDQAVAHREFLKNKLGADAAREIVVNLSAVTFADRASVLQHAVIIEDIMVAAYNGVVRLFVEKSYMTTISKMASVEARHSAYVRDLNSYNSFADATVVNSNGLGIATAPHVIMGSIQPYIQSRFDISKLPTY
jgi:hypothetical protein